MHVIKSLDVVLVGGQLAYHKELSGANLGV